MYPRLEATLRASHDKSNPTGVSRYNPFVTFDDDDEPLPEYGPSNAGMSNPNNRHDGQLEEGERAENERVVGASLIDLIPSMQQEIRMLKRRVAALENARSNEERERD